MEVGISLQYLLHDLLMLLQYINQDLEQIGSGLDDSACDRFGQNACLK